MKIKKRNNIFIVTGDFHEGKTTFAGEIAAFLIARNLHVSGFLSVGYFKNGKRHHFDIQDIETNEMMALCSAQKQDGWIKFRKFYFNPEAIHWGNQILINSQKSDLIIVDEIGPFELQREGWHEGLQRIIQFEKYLQVWVVRSILVNEVLKKFNIPKENVVDINKFTPEQACKRITSDE